MASRVARLAAPARSSARAPARRGSDLHVNGSLDAPPAAQPQRQAFRHVAGESLLLGIDDICAVGRDRRARRAARNRPSLEGAGHRTHDLAAPRSASASDATPRKKKIDYTARQRSHAVVRQLRPDVADARLKSLLGLDCPPVIRPYGCTLIPCQVRSRFMRITIARQS